MRPFLKWAGGKYRLVERIKSRLPLGSRLLEPFCGSCALSLNTDFQEFWLNDINQDLVRVYQIIQQTGPDFIDYCQSFFVPTNNLSERYYELRNTFNETDENRLKAALFLYLNRHGYNGLSRYNAQGEFNVPFGRYKKPYFPSQELHYFYRKFENATFTHLDFETMMMSARTGDVIYCDPPYLPLTATSNFTSYSAGGFGIDEQVRLAKVAAKVAKKGVMTVISNHYHPFILEIYQEAHIETFPVRRFISCNGSNRNEVLEILAIFS